MNKRQMKSEKKEIIHILQYNFLQESKFKVKFFILKCIKFFFNSIYTYSEERNYQIIDSKKRKKKYVFEIINPLLQIITMMKIEVIIFSESFCIN